MPNYDFSSLSSHDFEQLVRDLLQWELKVTLESFKQGRDKGIDLRYSTVQPLRPAVRRDIIIQCKHYAATPYSTFVSQLRAKEAPKVRSLQPSRYILVTSVALTPQNKTEIIGIFAPFILGPGDVFGKDDINNLLGKFPAVETAYFKLWLTSTVVLERILHSALFNESMAVRSRIAERMRLYVQNQSFHEAKRLLDKHHYCVIVGVPGIGKTTLAEILAVDYLARDYEVIVVSNDIRDAFGVHNPAKKQLFYYDDFLGQSGLTDKLHKNEDQALVRFVEVARSSGLTRLVLTTRDYIFNQAKLTYEKISRSPIDQSRCVVNLAAYTEPDRAKILFNHVYFSKLPGEYKRALVGDRGYRQILKHPNFSPRIVEWMTDISVHEATAPDGYVDEFVRNLSHPLRLWEHAYNGQLSNASRHLLLALATLPEVVVIEDLRQAFEWLFAFQSSRFGFSKGPDDFRIAVKESEANFLSVTSASAPSKEAWAVAAFHNPSIRDFLYDYLDENADYVRSACAAAIYFEQVERLWTGFARMAPTSSAPPTRAWLCANPDVLWNALQRTFLASGCALTWGHRRSSVYRSSVSYEKRLLFALSVLDVASTVESSKIIAGMLAHLYSELVRGRCDNAQLAALLSKVDLEGYDFGVAKREFLLAAKSAIRISVADLEGDDDLCFLDVDRFAAAAFFIREHEDLVSAEERRQLVDEFAKAVELYDDYDDFDRVRQIAVKIEAIAGDLEVDLSFEVSAMRERASAMEERAHENADDEYDRWRDDNIGAQDNERDIDDIFDSLSSSDHEGA